MMRWRDAIASLIVVALMVKVGYGLVKESGRIFLEAAPAGLFPDRIGRPSPLERDGGACEPGIQSAGATQVGVGASSFCWVPDAKERSCDQFKRHLFR
ncbi:MAG: hypothetical protein ACM3ML_39100 [Micromonosporaceae bacterium]